MMSIGFLTAVGLLVAVWCQRKKRFQKDLRNRILVTGAVLGLFLGLIIAIGIGVAYSHRQIIESVVLGKLDVRTDSTKDRFVVALGQYATRYLFFDAEKAEVRVIGAARGTIIVHEEDRESGVLEKYSDTVSAPFHWWAVVTANRGATAYHFRIPRGTLLTIKDYTD